MSKKKRNAPQRSASLFVRKRTDKNGRSYYLYNNGKRASKLAYLAQRDEKGHYLPSDARTAVLAMVASGQVENVQQARHVAAVTREYGDVLSDKQEEVDRGATQVLFYDLIAQVRNTDVESYNVRDWKTGKWEYYDQQQAIYRVTRLARAINKAIKREHKRGGSVYVFVPFYRDFAQDSIWFDFTSLDIQGPDPITDRRINGEIQTSYLNSIGDDAPAKALRVLSGEKVPRTGAYSPEGTKYRRTLRKGNKAPEYKGMKVYWLYLG